MTSTPWPVLASGLLVAASVSVVVTIALDRIAKHYPFYSRFVAAIAALAGWVAITVAKNPSTLEDPVLAGVRIALTVILGMQIAKLVAERRQRDVA